MHDLSIARIYRTIMSESKLCFPLFIKNTQCHGDKVLVLADSVT